jgi:hypothetical protein
LESFQLILYSACIALLSNISMKFSFKIILLICFVIPLTFLFSNVVYAEPLLKPELKEISGEVTVREPLVQSLINTSTAPPQVVDENFFTVVSIIPDNSIPALKEYARSKVGDVQFACLDKLWIKESNWKYDAQNNNFSPSSDGIPEKQAYGIPQSGPGLKMATMGEDWKTNPRVQIDWGIWYIENSSYKNPCAAWNHSVANNWY